MSEDGKFEAYKHPIIDINFDSKEKPTGKYPVRRDECALRDLCNALHDVTNLIERMNNRIYALEDRLDNMPDYELGGEDA